MTDLLNWTFICREHSDNVEPEVIEDEVLCYVIDHSIYNSYLFNVYYVDKSISIIIDEININLHWTFIYCEHADNVQPELVPWGITVIQTIFFL